MNVLQYIKSYIRPGQDPNNNHGEAGNVDTVLSCKSSSGGTTAADPEVVPNVKQAIADPAIHQATKQAETVGQTKTNPA